MAGKKFSLLKNFTTFNNDIKTKVRLLFLRILRYYSDNLSKNIEFQKITNILPLFKDDLITTVAINFPGLIKILLTLVNLKIQ